jgi:hypothetical protein
MGLTYVWQNQQECNSGEMNKTKKDSCNDVQRQATTLKISKNNSFVLDRYMNYKGTGTSHRILYQKRKKRNSLVENSSQEIMRNWKRNGYT